MRIARRNSRRAECPLLVSARGSLNDRDGRKAAGLDRAKVARHLGNVAERLADPSSPTLDGPEHSAHPASAPLRSFSCSLVSAKPEQLLGTVGISPHAPAGFTSWEAAHASFSAIRRAHSRGLCPPRDAAQNVAGAGSIHSLSGTASRSAKCRAQSCRGTAPAGRPPTRSSSGSGGDHEWDRLRARVLASAICGSLS